jgi:hypothetical protein
VALGGIPAAASHALEVFGHFYRWTVIRARQVILGNGIQIDDVVSLVRTTDRPWSLVEWVADMKERSLEHHLIGIAKGIRNDFRIRAS